MRILVSAPSEACAADALARVKAAGGAAATQNDTEPCDIEISLCAAPASAFSLVRLQAAKLSAAPQPQSAFDGAIALDAPSSLLRQQLTAWRRIAVARDECTRRALTARSLGLPPGTEARLDAARALFVGPAEPAFLALQHAFTKTGGTLNATHSWRLGFDHLHDETFDAVLLNGADDPQAALSFCAALRRNATLFHLPTMVLAAPPGAQAFETALKRGACATWQSPEPIDAPLGWLFETIRRERLRRQMERQLRAYRDLMSDPRSGLWKYEAFLAHLDRMTREHQSHKRPLSIVALRAAPAPGAQEPTQAAWKTVCLEVANLVARLVREADCATAFGPDQILIALPMSPLSCARRTATRIASVVECTSFVAGASDRSPIILEQSVAALAPGQSATALVASALGAFAQTPLSA